MAAIAPFRGFIYNPQMIQNLSQVVAPPYDVISPQEQDGFYALHPYNIIRLDFGKNFPSDTANDNRYTRAAHILKIWEREQILIQDPAPAFYLYKIRYRMYGQEWRTRSGFICRLGLEPLNAGSVRPHEMTFSAFKQDRYQLLQNCYMQFCPIFSFYLDKENRILSLMSEQAPAEPFIDFQDQASIQHQLWRITDPTAVREIQSAFSEKTVYIADGHHRYETSLAFQADMAKKYPQQPPEAPFNYTLMFLCPMEDPGLTIFPVHRALNRAPEMKPEELEKKLQPYFAVEKFPYTLENKKQVIEKFLSRLEGKEKETPTFGLYLTHTSWFYLLSLKKEGLEDDWAGDMHPLLRELDVMILSRLLFQKILGVRREELDQENMIEYRHDPLQTIKLVESGQSRMGFFLSSTPVEQVRRIAEASLVMPRKSTYFYPKTLTGLVMNPVHPDDAGSF
jgi:uncharacterized protein (DUF1015 family)